MYIHIYMWIIYKKNSRNKLSNYPICSECANVPKGVTSCWKKIKILKN